MIKVVIFGHQVIYYKKINFFLKGVILYILLSGVPPFFGDTD